MLTEEVTLDWGKYQFPPSTMRHWSTCRKIWLAVTLISLTLFILGLLFAFVIFPAIIDSRISDRLNLQDPDSTGRTNFVTSPYNITRKYSIFAISHMLDFTNGEKPVMVEYGPYAFRQVRHKKILQSSEKEKDITFEQEIRYVFDKGLSCQGCDEVDRVLAVVNVPMLVLVDMFQSDPELGTAYLEQLNRAIRVGSRYTDTLFMYPPMMKMILEGVTPPCLQWYLDVHPIRAQDLPESVINKAKGFFFLNVDANNTENVGFFEVTSAMNTLNEIKRFGTANASFLYPSLDELSWWSKDGGYKGSNYCNRLSESTDGLQFHPGIHKNERLWVFHPDMCRARYLEFQSKQNLSGLTLYRFHHPLASVKANTRDNLGFCMEAEKAVDWANCVKEVSGADDELDISECVASEHYEGNCEDGLVPVKRCMDGAPFVLSGPHFYQSPEILRMRIQGMAEGSEEKHGTYYDIEPETGIVVNFRRRWQMNIPIRPVQEITTLQRMAEVLLPMYWVDEFGTMDEAGLEAIKKAVTKPQSVFLVVQWVMVALGTLGLIAGASYFILWR